MNAGESVESVMRVEGSRQWRGAFFVYFRCFCFVLARWFRPVLDDV